MSFSISKIILHNRAPFEHLELDFSENQIAVLNAVNGGGKTTILSHIVDAWYEIVRLGLRNEFQGKEGKYYRVSSAIHNVNMDQYSLSYIRFMKNGKYFDYVDIRDACDQQEYEGIVKLENRIPFAKFQKTIEQSGNAKILSSSEGKDLEVILSNNIITYFPAYRYEEPGYLNEPFNVKTNFSLKSSFIGYLTNPIEVITGLPKLANWIMDVILDYSIQKQQLDALLKNKDQAQLEIPLEKVNPFLIYSELNTIFTKSLSIKSVKNLSIGIGERHSGALRIQVGGRDDAGKWYTVYPSIFNMSSGENAIVTLFGEILRQHDNIKPNIFSNLATGMVLIDEIDKHLHVRLQKEILPTLLEMFPNIQFIVTSHSPFVSLGLFDNEKTKERTNIIDLDKGCAQIDPASTQVFKEAYDVMVAENDHFHDLYNELVQKAQSEKLVIVSEGSNGKHIRRSIEILEPGLLNKLEFSFSADTGWQQLKNAYDALSNSNFH